MSRTWQGILGGAALVGMVAVPVLAQGPGGGRGRGGPGYGWGGPGGAGAPRLALAARALDLSDDQKAALEQLRAQHQAEVQPLLEQSRRLHQEVREALDAGTPDATAVGERVIAAHAAMAKVRASRDDLEERFQALLTPEQRETLKTLEQTRERLRGDRDGRRGRRGGSGRGPGGGFGPGPDGPPLEDDGASRR